MDSKVALSFFFLLLVSLSCEEDNRKVGSVIRIDYQGAKIKGGEWVQIDSFRFNHIEKRSDAKNIKYPIPSNTVTVSSEMSKKRKRDYNPRTFPVYIAKNIQKINKKIPKKKEFLVVDRFSMSYKGELKIIKRDSSKIILKTSKNYSAKISVRK
ncbi:hypothetical protein [Salinibacter sp.]|uniref:hypothetical protein n=1 Tax=Salinibacter sp. TaxID=2065818 RepID=UPI0021E94B6B|nr:hypothetical protein [Salinibacter sp.]